MIEDLGREIGLTTDQMGQLGSHRAAIQQDRETLSQCLRALREAREQARRPLEPTRRPAPPLPPPPPVPPTSPSP